jgi:hypothetical protein
MLYGALRAPFVTGKAHFTPVLKFRPAIYKLDISNRTYLNAFAAAFAAAIYRDAPVGQHHQFIYGQCRIPGLLCFFDPA